MKIFHIFVFFAISMHSFAESVFIGFDDLPSGTLLTSQYPGVIFSSSQGCANYVYSFSTGNIICTGPIGGSIDCVRDTYIDFTSPVNNLTFFAIEPNVAGVDAQFRIFQNNTYTTTIDLIGLGGAGNEFVDLSAYAHITRLEIVNILQSPLENGIGWDSFSFTPVPTLSISSLQTPSTTGNLHSFIATDTITLQAKVNPPNQGMAVKWTVMGIGPAGGISGFPRDQIQNTDGGGVSTFTFSPSDNPAFVTNRRTTWATASTAANDPIGFEVIAELDSNGQSNKSSLSATNLGSLLQDQTDTLREEYYDFNVPVPSRNVIVPSLGATYNESPYSVQASVDLPGHYSAILSAYRSSTLIIGTQSIPIPSTANVVISSAFRNPRRNLAIGSVHPNSKHTVGQALDLQPVPTFAVIDGVRTMLDLHDDFYPALATAAATQGTAIAEQGAVPVSIGDIHENHIHVQWLAGTPQANSIVAAAIQNAIQSHAAALILGGDFSYTVFNDEPANSSFQLNAFHLVVNAPFSVTSSPAGWSFVTDNFSYVDWFCSSGVAPYMGDIAPGTSMQGFSIHSQVSTSASLSFVMSSWNPGTASSGPGYMDTIASPSITTVVPQLTNIGLSSGRDFQFSVSGIPGYSYTIQYSSDLINWAPILTTVAPFNFIDPNSAVGPSTFYRAVFVPQPSTAPDD